MKFNYARARDAFTCLFILGIAVLLTGCIWMRLLAFKNQLADFDRYVQVDDHQGLSFQFLKPVVHDQDVRQLLEVDPTSSSTNQNLLVWNWVFEKQLPRGQVESNTFDIAFATSFTNHNLCRLTVPDHLLALMPKDFVVGIFRSLGKARISKLQRTLNAEWRHDAEKELKMLSQSELRQLLGNPYSSSNSESGAQDVYLYKPKSPSLNPSTTKPARIECAFAPGNGRLLRVKASYLAYQCNVAFTNTP